MTAARRTNAAATSATVQEPTSRDAERNTTTAAASAAGGDVDINGYTPMTRRRGAQLPRGSDRLYEN